MEPNKKSFQFQRLSKEDYRKKAEGFSLLVVWYYLGYSFLVIRDWILRKNGTEKTNVRVLIFGIILWVFVIGLLWSIS